MLWISGVIRLRLIRQLRNSISFLQIVGGCVAVLMVVLMSVMFRYVRRNPEKFKYDVPFVCPCLQVYVRA